MAIEVPERTLVDPLLDVEMTLRPGAQTSTPVPKFEKEAFVSSMVEAATVMACLTRAGEEFLTSSFSFPAATTTGTPKVKS